MISRDEGPDAPTDDDLSDCPKCSKGKLVPQVKRSFVSEDNPQYYLCDFGCPINYGGGTDVIEEAKELVAVIKQQREALESARPVLRNAIHEGMQDWRKTTREMILAQVDAAIARAKEKR